MLALSATPAQAFLRSLGGSLPRPRAIVVASPHFLAREPVVVADPQPPMIYDFGGFPDELYRITYPAPGEPVLAGEVAKLIRAAGLPVHLVGERGFDHGTWVPLSLMFPEADIPIVQLSIQPEEDAEYHLRLGRALEPLRDEDVLIVGTGAMTHNLRELMTGGLKPADAPPEDWALAFTNWIAEKAEAGDADALVGYATTAPSALRAHPADDHFLPFFVALGAAGDGAHGERIHASIEHGALAMDAYRFT